MGRITRRREGDTTVVDVDFSREYKEKMYIKIAATVLIIGAVTVLGLLLPHAFDRQEIAECLKWQAQAEEFSGNPVAARFYLAKWQKEQCDAHSITINAPVK